MTNVLNLARLCGTASLTLMLATGTASAAWEPAKPVEIIVAAAARGI